VVKGRIAAAVAFALFWAAAPAHATPLPEAPNCPLFPTDNVWHAPVTQLPVHPKSATYVASIGTNAHVHADFGSGLWAGGPIGIPYNVVGAGQTKAPVTFQYDSESDHVGYPVPANPAIEGGSSSTGDRHVLVVDNSTCTLYELYAAYPNGNGTWRAGSGAVWNLNSNALRPDTWTSADAAGLPILPGLVRYDEVAAGTIDHAIRVTVPSTDASYLWPARHQAGSPNSSLPPMGLRLRLRSTFDVSGFAHDAQAILQAMKTYGVIVADNGSPWFISGVPDSRWNNDVLHQLDVVKGSDFEAIDESSLMIDPNSAATGAGAQLQWHVRNSNTPGPPSSSFSAGPAGGIALACDFAGHGVDTPAVFAGGVWYIRLSSGGGPADLKFAYGTASDQPVCGDWNHDGSDTIGVYENAHFYLRNTNAAGKPDVDVFYGTATDVPVAGDWNHDGTDTIGVYEHNHYYLRDTNTPGPPSSDIWYGGPGDAPVVGDWNDDGTDTIGVYEHNHYYLRDTNTPGPPSSDIWYGGPVNRPVTGDWDGDGRTTIGVAQ
jgi:hypothetical protein